MDTEKQTPTSSPARALPIVGKKDLEPRPGNYSRPTPIPQAHTVLRPQDSCPGEGGATNPFGCARPFPSLPRFIGQNPLRSHHAQPPCTNNTSKHHIILDSTLCRGGGEGKPGQQRLPFPTPTYIISPQAMYAHPPDGATLPQCRLTSENTRRPRHLLAAGRRERESGGGHQQTANIDKAERDLPLSLAPQSRGRKSTPQSLLSDLDIHAMPSNFVFRVCASHALFLPHPCHHHVSRSSTENRGIFQASTSRTKEEAGEV